MQIEANERESIQRSFSDDEGGLLIVVKGVRRLDCTVIIHNRDDKDAQIIAADFCGNVTGTVTVGEHTESAALALSRGEGEASQ